MPYPQQKSKIDRTEKQILGIFAIIGIASLIFGILYFRENIRSPFRNFYPDYNKKTQEQEQTEELLALKTQDSDSDTLTDYDEIYQHNTSRFLADTDSDGIADNTEIKNGTNPLCPEGKTCIAVTTNTNTNASNTNSLDLNAMTAEQLRELLKQNGVTEEELNLIGDDQLLDYYHSLLNENINTGELVNQAASNINSLNSNINAAEVRRILINSGNFTEEDLKNINDADLVQIYQEAMQ